VSSSATVGGQIDVAPQVTDGLALAAQVFKGRCQVEVRVGEIRGGLHDPPQLRGRQLDFTQFMKDAGQVVTPPRSARDPGPGLPSNDARAAPASPGVVRQRAQVGVSRGQPWVSCQRFGDRPPPPRQSCPLLLASAPR